MAHGNSLTEATVASTEEKKVLKSIREFIIMSQAEVIKACRVKTNIVKRLHKELAHYQKEEKQEQARVDKMKADGVDKFDLKQAVSSGHSSRVYVSRAAR